MQADDLSIKQDADEEVAGNQQRAPQVDDAYSAARFSALDESMVSTWNSANLL